MTREKWALVTGASRGLGEAVALQLLEQGYCVWGTASSQESIDKLTLKYKEKVFFSVVDFTQKNNIDDLLVLVKERKVKFECIVNNAGIFKGGHFLEEEDDELFEQVLTVNLLAQVRLTRGLLKNALLDDKQGAVIVNISSVAAKKVFDDCVSYGVSKAALSAFSAALRHCLKQTKHKVVTIHPGAIYTDMWKQSEVDEDRLMKVTDVAQIITDCVRRKDNSIVIEDMTLRPQLGDL